MNQIIHSPLFWVDTIGLTAQGIALWYGAMRLKKQDWPYGLIFGITSILSLFSAFGPAFDVEWWDRIRRSLHTATAVSFVALIFYIVRRIPIEQSRFAINLRNVAIGFVVLGSLTLFLVKTALSYTTSDPNSADIERKVAIAAKNSIHNGAKLDATLKAVQSDTAGIKYRTRLVEDLMKRFDGLVEKVEQIYFVVQQTRMDQLREYRRRQQWEKMHDQRLQEVERAVEK